MTMNRAIEKIVESKTEEVAVSKKLYPEKHLTEVAAERALHISFADSLAKNSNRVNVIAEIKRASPTGVFMPKDFDPVAIARSYEKAGAASISVLTDTRYFCGSPLFVPLVKKEVSIPVLRKEFIIDKWQLAESAALGADAVLLMAVLFDSADQLEEMYHYAKELGLDVLMEIHTEDEWKKVEQLRPEIVGINNRDFMSPDLAVDFAATKNIAPLLPDGVTIISESGIRGAEDMERLNDYAHAFLIGSLFMKDKDPGRALAQTLAALQE